MGCAVSHAAVLVDEAMHALRLQADGVYVDCTFGSGGHATEILRRIGPRGRVLALEKDPHAVAAGRRLAHRDSRLRVVRASFSRLAEVVASQGVGGTVNGILFDLGVSSGQLDDPARGFSFQRDGPLDMRMDPDQGVSAAEWLRAASERRIVEVIRGYGEERYARRIARAIVRARERAAIETTRQLATIVAAACPTRERGKHPATRTFQALRIHVNDELGELAAVLPQVPPLLAPAGRLLVISFHSLEDRIVKRFMRQHSRPRDGPPRLPIVAPAAAPPLRVIGRIVRPAASEVGRNPRARSAILRVAERTA